MQRWLPLIIAVTVSVIVTVISFIVLKDLSVGEILSILSSLFILSAIVLYFIDKHQK